MKLHSIYPVNNYVILNCKNAQNELLRLFNTLMILLNIEYNFILFTHLLMTACTAMTQLQAFYKIKHAFYRTAFDFDDKYLFSF